MNILEACKAMAEGDAVRRAAWKTPSWIAFAMPMAHMHAPNAWTLVSWDGVAGKIEAFISLAPADLMAEDWVKK